MRNYCGESGVTNMSVLVNLVSESSFTVRGHGVDSAFRDQLAALHLLDSLEIVDNSLTRSDVTHAHTAGPFAATLLQRADYRVITAHLMPESLNGSIVAAEHFSYMTARYLRWFYNKADMVVALSDMQAIQLRELGISRPIEIVPNSWPSDLLPLPQRRTARDFLGLPNDRQIVLTVGQMQPRKAPSAFYSCAEKSPDVLFIWVGGAPFGPLTSGYRDFTRTGRILPPNVIHTGSIPRASVYTYYAAADIYFHPSHHELCPVAVLEAAAAGLPLLVRDLPTYRHLLSQGCIEGTEKTFAADIDWVLSDSLVRAELAGLARSVAATCGPDATARRLAEIYFRLAG
jgi:1,2-diacylglycerol-3-alpha-glucose alpha-1,2-galactosyltransferase